MANPVQAHPEADQLQAFSRGALADEAASQWISSHLESCPACLRTLESLSSDTLESLVRAAQKPDATADFGDADDPNAEAEDLSFLAPPQAPDEIGRLGPYRVLKVLGSGGMGIVFQAEDIALKRRVALKVMKPHAARRPKAKERFLREAQAAAAIEHDHIVTIHQVGEERGVPFLAMPLLKGMSLEDRLRTTGDTPLPPLNTQHILRIGQQIAVGLAAAHEQGLIHRDIKPANLWLTPVQGGRIKILDFGLARALADDVRLTQSGTIVGTPTYMAPEQGRGDNVDHRCDLFSLGVVLYRLTTGRLPFRGESTMAVLTSLAMDTPEPPRKLVATLPMELSDLIMHLLAKDPSQRPATARAVADRLRDIDQQLGATRLQPEQTETLPLAQPSAMKPSRKWPLAIAASLGALALLVAAAVLFLQTPDGTVRIEINDDGIEATLTKNGAVIKGADKAHDITVAAGEQTLKIKRGDLEFETDKFVLKKGDKVTLKIELLPGKVQVVRDDKVIGEKALPLHANDRKAAVWVLSLGGRVTIDDGQERTIRSANDLPASLWMLRKVDLNFQKLVGDAELKSLASLRALRGLAFVQTQVTDVGLYELADHKTLRELYLSNTKVTDTGLVHLKGLSTLKTLDLTNTSVTAKGVALLQKALPDCKIISDFTPAAGDADRKAAAWVLSLGGTVLIDDGQQREIQVRSAKDLPAGPLTLRNIHLSVNQQVDDAGLKNLAGLKSLRILNLEGTKVTAAGLEQLAGLKELTRLSLAQTSVTDAGLKPLATLKNLQLLNLNATAITDAGLKNLATLQKLYWLQLTDTKVTDAGLKKLAEFKSLQELFLNDTPVTDAGLVHLQGMTTLKVLDVTKTSVTVKGIAALQKALPGCKITSDVKPVASDDDRKAAEWVLSLGGSMLIDDGQERKVSAAKDLPAGPWTLHTITLNDKKQVTDASLKELAGLKTLLGLDLARTKVTDAGLKELAGLKSLQILNLNGTPVSGAGLKELADLKGLQWLSLWDTPVTDAELKELADLKGLQWLSLGNTKVTDVGLKELAKLKSLQDLNLWGTPVTDTGVVHLQGLTNLKKLDLTRTSVTAKGVAALQKALPDCEIISDFSPAVVDPDRKAAEWVLSLGGTVTIHDGQERKISAAKDLPAGAWTLQKIDLNRNKQVDDAGLKKLVGLKRLHVLYLYDTKVTDAGLKELANLKSLQELNLDNTQITDAGLKELAGLHSLHALDLGNTQVTDAGLKELANLKSLRDLVLFNTEVTDAGLKELAALKSLQSLYLAHTDVTDAGLVHLQNLTNLKTLDLAETKATAKGIAALQKALPGCKIIRE